MDRSALIVGAEGQDGFYLTAHLEKQGYQVFRAGRDAISVDGVTAPFDVLDAAAVARQIERLQPREIYYLAAYHHSSQERTVGVPELLALSHRVHCEGLCNILEAVAAHVPSARVFYAASSLVFGAPAAAPQNEVTPLAPICVYGITKVAGIGLCRLYARERGIFASVGILYNHESPRRADKFITRKLVKAAVSASRGDLDKVTIGHFDAKVDWSAAEDVVQAMHAMLQLDQPGEFVVASGTLHTVRDFAEAAFALVGLDYRQYVEEQGALIQRAVRSVPLQGDSSALRRATGWEPRLSFRDLVESMMRAELDALHD